MFAEDVPDVKITDRPTGEYFASIQHAQLTIRTNLQLRGRTFALPTMLMSRTLLFPGRQIVGRYASQSFLPGYFH